MEPVEGKPQTAAGAIAPGLQTLRASKVPERSQKQKKEESGRVCHKKNRNMALLTGLPFGRVPKRKAKRFSESSSWLRLGSCAFCRSRHMSVAKIAFGRSLRLALGLEASAHVQFNLGKHQVNIKKIKKLPWHGRQWCVSQAKTMVVNLGVVPKNEEKNWTGGHGRFGVARVRPGSKSASFFANSLTNLSAPHPSRVSGG